MSHHNEEQLEEVKDFFAKSWKTIAAVIIIGLLAIWGWRYWQDSKKQQAVEASDRYEALIAALDESKPESINELVSFAKNTDTIYSAFANLKAAQFYVETVKDYAKAEEVLLAISKNTDSEAVLTTANIRLAQVQNQLGKYNEALATLDKINSESWAAVVMDLKGDILMKMDSLQDAINTYQIALQSQPVPELENGIKIKLNQAEYLLKQQTKTDEAVTSPTNNGENSAQ